MAHCAVSDVNGNRYEHSPLFKLGVPPVQANRYTLALDFPPGHRADANGGGGHDHVTLTLPAWSLDLAMTSDDATVPPALHYGGLAHDYACGGYTYYYSRPRMAATGTLTLDGTALEVSGTHVVRSAVWRPQRRRASRLAVVRDARWPTAAASCCLTSSTCQARRMAR